MKQNKITTSDLMLGDVIAFKNQWGKVTPPYEVEALEKDYVRALLLYRNDDTPSDEFNICGKNGDEIVDVELTNEYLHERFKIYYSVKGYFEYELGSPILAITGVYANRISVFGNKFLVTSYKESFDSLNVYAKSKKVRTVREFQKELKRINKLTE